MPLSSATRRIAMNERLWEIYEQLCLIEYRPLQEFVRRLKAGEFGEFRKEEVVDFLRWVEGNMLQNIQVKAMESPAYAEMAEHVSEETQRMFEELIAEYERG